MGLPGTLTINAVIPPIPFYIYVSNSLRKYTVFIMTVVLKIFYGTEKKYWQSQLLTCVKGLNNVSDLYSVKRKDCRKH